MISRIEQYLLPGNGFAVPDKSNNKGLEMNTCRSTLTRYLDECQLVITYSLVSKNIDNMPISKGEFMQIRRYRSVVAAAAFLVSET